MSTDWTDFPLQLSQESQTEERRAVATSRRSLMVLVRNSALEGGSLWLSDATGHCYPGPSDGEAPEPTVRVTTMAKVLPIGLPGSFIVPPTTPSPPLLGLLGKPDWTKRSLRSFPSSYDSLSLLLIVKGNICGIYILQQNVHAHSLNSLI